MEKNLSRGFLPNADPLKHLSDSFAVWESIASELPKLLLSDELRSKLENLSEFPFNQLTSEPELERAMLMLSFLGHAYVWGAELPAAKIPAVIAIPWHAVASKLERLPILSYASYALNNWQRLEQNKPIELGNIALLQNFLGGIDEEWFVLVHVEIEAKAAPALAAMTQAQKAVNINDAKQLAENLEIMRNSLMAMCTTLDRMPERCDPYIYYHRVRPYIHGWKDNPALPNGIIYEGVKAYQNKPQKFRGETGAQSSIIPSFDAALDIRHKNDPLRVYLQEMREYMPTQHRQFIEKIEQGPSIRQYVKENLQKQPMLKELYNENVLLITRFRETHISYAGRYIQKQSQTSLSNPTETGTGGTPFMFYLKKHIDESKEHLL